MYAAPPPVFSRVKLWGSYSIPRDTKPFTVTGCDIQCRHGSAVQDRSGEGCGASPAAGEGLIVAIVICGQGRAATGIGRGHYDIRAVP